MKSKKSLSGEKKYYLADMSFYFLRNTDNRINYGLVLENIFLFLCKEPQLFNQRRKNRKTGM